MDQTSSMSVVPMFTGVKKEFRDGILLQTASFANAAKEGIKKLNAIKEDWPTGVANLLKELQSIYGLRNRSFEQILHHSIKGDLTKERSVSEFLGVCKCIKTFCSKEKPLEFKRISIDPENPFISGIFILCVGHRKVPAFHNTIEWFNRAELSGALWPKFQEIENPAPEEKVSLTLTESQQTVYDQLAYAIWLRGSPLETVGQVWSRPFPLLMGTSGSGKTTVVRRLAVDQNLPILILDSGGWIVEGAARQPSTLTWIRNQVEHAPRGIIFIDELDKFSAAGDWCKHIQQELMALLDGRLDSYEWSPEIIQRLKKWIIIGAGTWQGLVKNESMGFLPKQNSAESKIREQADIPEELLARFNSCWLYVAPPSRVDIRNALIRIHNEMNHAIPENLEGLVTDAVSSGQNMRWLERYLSDLLYVEYQLTRLTAPASTKEWHGELFFE